MSTENSRSRDRNPEESNGQTTETELDGLLVTEQSSIAPVVSIVVPTLNEEKGIRICMSDIKEAIAEIGLPTEVIVSDSSSDRTPDIADRLGAIVVEPEGKGYGNAYKHGFDQARGEFIAMGDADTTYDFGELPKLYKHLRDENADMVLGSRLNGEIKQGAMPPLHRYVGNPLLTRFLNMFYGAGVSDSHSGMRILTRDALEKMRLESDGMEFASEMIMDAAANDLTIAEVPITYHERVGDATLDSFSDGWRHVKFMLTNAPGYVFTYPALTFGVLGLCLVVGSMLGVPAGPVTLGIQTLVVGVLCVAVGYQAASLSVFSSVGADPISRPDDPLTEWIRQNFSLKTGLLTGICTCLVGGVFLLYRVSNGSVGGPGRAFAPKWTLLAVGTIAIGVQTLLNSVFFSLLSQHADR